MYIESNAHCTVQNPSFTMRVLGSNTAQCTYCTSAQCTYFKLLPRVGTHWYTIVRHQYTQCAFNQIEHRSPICTVHIASTNFGFTRKHSCSTQPSTTCCKPPVLCSTTALCCGPLQMHLATILSADTNVHRRPPNPSRSLASFYFTSSQMFAEQKDLIRFRKHSQQANTFMRL